MMYRSSALLLVSFWIGLSLAQVQVPLDGVGIAIGGFSGGVSIEVIDGQTVCENFDSQPPLPNAPAGTIEGWNAEFVDNKIFLCGGSTTDQFSDCYSMAITGSWERTGQTNYPREYGTSFVFNGEMMIIGGFNEVDFWTNLVEKKVSGTDQWEIMTPWLLPDPLMNLCAAQMDETHIIVVGGNGIGNRYTEKVLILDTVANTWTETVPLPTPLAKHSCINTEYQGDMGLLVTGGCSNQCSEHTAETRFYNYRTQQWVSMPSLADTRDSHEMTYINGNPAVVGGNRVSTGPVETVEIFDGTSWQTIAGSLKFPRHSFGMPKYVPSGAVFC